MDRTVVALFNEVRNAQQAVEALLSEGINQNDIGVVRASEGLASSTAAAGSQDTGDANISVPRSTAGTLARAGIPEERAELYAEGIRLGGTLVTVRTSETEYDRTMQILNGFSPVDMSAQATQVDATGATSSDENLYPYTNVYTRRFEDFETEFRHDWQARYGNQGYNYERCRPAYRYGWDAQKLLGGRDWQAIEPDLKADWARTHPDEVWADFRDAVRAGWERAGVGDRDAG
jgi:hypothetical protein